jgi:hypothetical protein
VTEEPCYPNCRAEFKTKYMIRVEHDSNDETAKRHLESRTKRSVVGWIKHVIDNFPFEDITIYNLLTECPVHKEYWEKKMKS